MFFHDTNDTVNNQNEEVVTKDSAQKVEQEMAQQEEPVLELSQQEITVQELALCKIESAQWKEQYLRARADLDNFSKRVEKERSNTVLFAQAQVLLDLVAVMDDFDRALAEEHKDAPAQLVAWRTGVEMIRASLDKVLETYGVKAMADYTIFNPELHEAISQIIVEGKSSGSIVHVAQKGYVRNGVVLRAAKVVVAQ